MSEEQAPFPEGVVHVVDDGGSAFPVLDNNGHALVMREPGMSLRDYFAGQALAGLFSSDVILEAAYLEASDKGGKAGEEIAEYAYSMADAMIAARAQYRGGAA